ncbi:Rieske 2Fe-2S domain-containing protein [Melissospora conviva]|uniref:Rieske 2Fe-2S domain-containing protein n=1 Tax=Melissospora conviva TaxID=3388432 RepID=UPI003C26E2B6
MSALTKIEQAEGLDRISDRLQQRVLRVLRPRKLRDALHGVWLGHALHPALVQLPVGAWASSAILDLLPVRKPQASGQRHAATALVGVGVATAVPAALTGSNDWAHLNSEQRRVGLVHAAANSIGLVCYTGSLIARLTGRHRLGRTLGLAGLSAVSAGAYLGGHLVYKQGAQVNQSIAELNRIDEGWHPVIDLADLPERTMVTREVDGVSVIVYHDGDDITVMLERCPHESGPLGEGDVVEIDGNPCVVCPWHGSTFRLGGGEIVHGPASTDQQVLSTRVVDGMLQARV